MKSSKYAVSAAIIAAAIIITTGIYFRDSLFQTDTYAPIDSNHDQYPSHTDYPVDNGQDKPQDQQVYEKIYKERQALSNSLVGYTIEATFLPEAVQVPHPEAPYEYDKKLFKVGTITNGSLKGETLYLEEQRDMAIYYSRAIVRGNIVGTLWPEKFSFSYEARYPDTLSVPGTPHKLKKASSGGFLFGTTGKVSPLFNSPEVGMVSSAESTKCVLAELPDHSGLVYDLDIPFANEESGLLSLRLTTGANFSEEYSFFDYSCGSYCRTFKYVDPQTLNPSTRLTQVATDPQTGEAIYGIASSEDPVLKAIYADTNTLAYFRPENNWEHDPVNKYTYAEFIQYRPLLYWKDPWGRWIEFRNKRFEAAAEKCKPVIYLYPEKPGTFHVEVKPNGGFTKTIPEYKNGWDVLAMPDGTLTDILTGIKYPYLYWSGIGINYPKIEEGWVVSKEDMSAFLDEKLYTLGLQGQEISDFKEYWVERLSERPYYKIGFVAPRDFNKLAPLTVGPEKPNTVIRVMMTAQGIDSKETLRAPRLPLRPQRNGFTVVEWGGSLLY